jgi:hypothetical protein
VPFPRIQGQASHRSGCRMASCPLLLGPQASHVAPQAADQGHGGTRIAIPPKHIRCQKHRPCSQMPGAAARWAASPACFAELREKPSHGLSANLTRYASPSRHGLFDQRPSRRPVAPPVAAPTARLPPVIALSAAPPAAPIAPPLKACCRLGRMLAHPRWPSGRRRR